jgi:hypothetical protein
MNARNRKMETNKNLKKYLAKAPPSASGLGPNPPVHKYEQGFLFFSKAVKL